MLGCPLEKAFGLMRLITLFTSIIYALPLVAAERDLVVDALTSGPYEVGSANFRISDSALTELQDEGLDAGQLQQGMNNNGELRYISELLASPDDAFYFQVLVPDDSTRYGESAGSLIPYAGYVLYPTKDSNDRANYDVFIPPSLPHMQSEGEGPIFADDNFKYPMLVYSHGQGDHPTSTQLSFLIDLASHGYVVIALYHGDNRFSGTEPRQFNLRPLAVKNAIDEILGDSAYANNIDPDRIGGLGGSFGGATMLALLGAQIVNPDFSSVASNSLIETTVDTRIKAAAAIVPYMGLGTHTFFGTGSTGTATVDRPFLANSANSDEATDFSKVQAAMTNIPGVKYLVEYDGEGHAMSDGAVSDAYTWMKLFSDAFVKQDAAAMSILSRIQSVEASGSDSLVQVTEPTTSLDADSDGIGDESDDDDDNDGMTDVFEVANGLNPFLDDAAEDSDGDGATNLQEFESGTDPADSNSVDACFATDAVGIDASASTLPVEQRLYFANPGSNSNQQTFLRFSNPNNTSASVEVYGIDDGGNLSKKEPFSFNLAANASIQLTAQDIENGNSSKGLTSNLCDGQGKWQFRIRSDNAIRVMGLIRTPDGFLTSMDDVVPKSGDDNFIYFANPATNTNQQTFLRIVNTTSSSGTVTISGIDDTGTSSNGSVNFDLGSYEAKQLTTADLENGNSNKGLTGSLGDGSGKWQLTVTSSLALEAMSLIRTADGFLTNLSGVVDKDTSDQHVVYFANPASETIKTTFLRIINTSSEIGDVIVSGVDDSGSIAPGGDVQFSLGAKESKQMVVSDLENGNLNKGLLGALGSGNGRWRLTITSSLSLQVMSLVRTPDGFLTNLSRTSPVTNNINDIYFFNPGSNTNQQSSLRLVNNSDQQGSVTISGFDDTGAPATGGDVSFNIGADSAMVVTAQDLENGNANLGLVGAFGDGSGKWRLRVSSDVSLQVQSLLDTQSGFLTNLSQTAE